MHSNSRRHGDDAFQAHAEFYDVLYSDKDYEAECDFIELVLSERGIDRGAALLDLGCGTGGHALLLAERGYAVTGVDRSPAMVQQAIAKREDRKLSVDFLVGDVRWLDLGSTYDAVISMFAVASYQLTDDDLVSMFSVARRHLRPGGLFVFDAWFGPAVLVEQPEPRTKQVVTPSGEIVSREATPRLDILRHTVEVTYDVSRERDGVLVERNRESHVVRFLFAREIEHLLGHAGLELVALGTFMDLEREPTTSDWSISVVARAL